MNIFQRLIHFFIPKKVLAEREKDYELYEKYWVFALISIVIASTGVFIFLRELVSYEKDMMRMKIQGSAMLIIWGILFFAKLGKNLKYPVLALCTLAFFLFPGRVLAFGTIFSPTMFWFFFLPVGVVYFLGMKISIILALITIVQVVTLDYVLSYGFNPMRSIDAPDSISFLSSMFLALAVNLVFIYVQDRSRRRLLEKDRLQQEELHRHARLSTIGEVASNIAHEISSPLSVVLNCSELIEMELEKGEPNLKKIAKYNKKITDVNEKTIHMLKGLLKLSRQPDHKLHSVKLLDVWDSLYPLLENKLKYSGIELRGNYKEHMENRYLALVEYLAQVFLNLMMNAVHSIDENCTKDEERYIQIDVFPSKTVTIFEISDSGPGVPEELVEKVFASYFTTKEDGEGTGLGLSICRTVMERMDGGIQIKKINGKNFFEVRVRSDNA